MSRKIQAINANPSHHGAAPQHMPYCQDHSKVTSYALCLNDAKDYPRDDRRTFCSICPCGKDALEGIPQEKKTKCGPFSGDCPNIVYQADGTVRYN